MNKPGAPKGPQKQPDKTIPPKPEGGKKKPGEKEKKVDRKSKLSQTIEQEVMNAGIMYDLKIILKLWGKLWTDLENIGENFENIQRTNDTRELTKKLKTLKDKVKVPKITDADKLKTKLAVMKATDSTVKYLYASLNIPMPKLDQIKPPQKEIKLAHLIKQLEDSGVYMIQGKRKILQQAGKRPPSLYKGDLIVIGTKTGEFIPGFIEAMDDTRVYIRNNKSAKPQIRYTNELFLAFHFPGNKFKGNEIPSKPGAKPQKAAKKKKV
jgi:hypothetical protein